MIALLILFILAMIFAGWITYSKYKVYKELKASTESAEFPSSNAQEEIKKTLKSMYLWLGIFAVLTLGVGVVLYKMFTKRRR